MFCMEQLNGNIFSTRNRTGFGGGILSAAIDILEI